MNFGCQSKAGWIEAAGLVFVRQPETSPAESLEPVYLIPINVLVPLCSAPF